MYMELLIPLWELQEKSKLYDLGREKSLEEFLKTYSVLPLRQVAKIFRNFKRTASPSQNRERKGNISDERSVSLINDNKKEEWIELVQNNIKTSTENFSWNVATTQGPEKKVKRRVRKSGWSAICSFTSSSSWFAVIQNHPSDPAGRAVDHRA